MSYKQDKTTFHNTRNYLYLNPFSVENKWRLKIQYLPQKTEQKSKS